MKTKLMISGILQGFRFNAVAGIAGLLLLLLGFLVFSPLKFIGAAALVFYLLISILQPVNLNSNVLRKGRPQNEELR